mgnify:FL=1
MDQYKLESKKGDGAFSGVFQAQSIKTGKHVAIKCMKKQFESIGKVRKLKELRALWHLSPHEHIIKPIEVLYDEPTGTHDAKHRKTRLRVRANVAKPVRVPQE